MFSGYQQFIKSLKFIFTEYRNKKIMGFGGPGPFVISINQKFCNSTNTCYWFY